MTAVFEFEPALSWVKGSPSFPTANHEAGHAVVALWHGFEVREARIDRPDYGVNGWCHYTSPDREDPELLRARLQVALAGPLAEPRPLDWKSYHERHAMELAVRLGWGRDELDAEIAKLQQLLRTLRAQVCRVSGLLLERGAIPGDELPAPESATP